MPDLELAEERQEPGIFAAEEYKDNLHVLLMGRPGSGKSTFAATFPKPMLVFGFDPGGKEDPYLERGAAGPVQAAKIAGVEYYFRDVASKKDKSKLVVRYEYWGESNPLQPTRYPAFMARTMRLEEEIREMRWATIVLDSATYFELAARSYSECGINKGVADGRQHYAFSAHACEQYLMMRVPNLLLANTVTICHVDDQQDFTGEGGVTIRKMAALPGKLPNRIAGGYGECWYIYQPRSGHPERLLQTDERDGNKFDCKSLKKFGDPCPAHYELLWKTKRRGE